MLKALSRNSAAGQKKKLIALQVYYIFLPIKINLILFNAGNNV